MLYLMKPHLLSEGDICGLHFIYKAQSNMNMIDAGGAAKSRSTCMIRPFLVRFCAIKIQIRRTYLTRQLENTCQLIA